MGGQRYVGWKKTINCQWPKFMLMARCGDLSSMCLRTCTCNSATNRQQGIESMHELSASHTTTTTELVLHTAWALNLSSIYCHTDV